MNGVGQGGRAGDDPAPKCGLSQCAMDTLRQLSKSPKSKIQMLVQRLSAQKAAANAAQEQPREKAARPQYGADQQAARPQYGADQQAAAQNVLPGASVVDAAELAVAHALRLQPLARLLKAARGTAGNTRGSG